MLLSGSMEFIYSLIRSSPPEGSFLRALYARSFIEKQKYAKAWSPK